MQAAATRGPAGQGKGGAQGARPAQPNVMQQSAGWLNQAGQAAGQAANYRPMQVRPNAISAATVGNPADIRAAQVGNPANVRAGQVANTNLAAYQDPHTRQVIDASMADMNRARQMTQNANGAQATAAGAFGGSRHGLVEAETNRGFAQEAGQLASGLRSQGFQNAQGMAQFDIGNRMQAGMFNAGQDMQAGLANQASTNAMGQFNSAQGFQAGLANQAARNGTSQFNSGQSLQGQTANQQAGLAGAGVRLNGAGQLSGLAGQGFGMGQAINGQQMQQGTMQQGLAQQLIDAAKGQWGGYTGAPGQSLAYPLGAVSGVPHGQTQTTRQNPGLMQFLSLGLGL